jgi:hypothetical protein
MNFREFVAVHESVRGPSRHFAATQQFSRFRGEADIGARVPIAESDANDRFQKLERAEITAAIELCEIADP